MDGRIWFDSEDGVGTCFGFQVTLPLAKDAPEGSDTPAVPRGLGRVLIVDDHPVNRTVLEKQIAMLGADPVCCASGEEALARIGEGFDVLITDHNMPGMDGMELAEAVRDAGHDLPIVMLTSTSGCADSEPGRRLLAAVLQRPTPRHDLFRALASLGLGPVKSPFNTSPTHPAARSAPLVLAAEDNATNRLVLSKMLGHEDLTLTFAENGEEAVAQWDRLRPDIILMDLSMPRMDGAEATRLIREAEAARHLPRTPIIAVTAHVLKDSENEVRRLGMDGYIGKPMRKAAVLDLIATWTANRASTAVCAEA